MPTHPFQGGGSVVQANGLLVLSAVCLAENGERVLIGGQGLFVAFRLV